ncbi:hypothetical protein CLUG_01092 [Clavispora lusitaniae ATCC 42720]|uniref:Uncharacterized protein n=1 Tax=Clavispora lusitaniae (strain ATCC 42720) TaxID=306902 RepID=C4XYR9_CLAL4|nr:uncharacterized protein CLUG_01092 [Clavispora lusitaniae ATCC 42720]EEQ36969.1 hypothetical protein CLUG_01092 [Clavispora lusitaniae ATCC 42720]
MNRNEETHLNISQYGNKSFIVSITSFHSASVLTSNVSHRDDAFVCTSKNTLPSSSDSTKLHQKKTDKFSPHKVTSIMSDQFVQSSISSGSSAQDDSSSTQKAEQFVTEYGLDQEIQRAIAQHDLAQQLQQQNETDNSESKMGANNHESEHEGQEQAQEAEQQTQQPQQTQQTQEQGAQEEQGQLEQQKQQTELEVGQEQQNYQEQEQAQHQESPDNHRGDEQQQQQQQQPQQHLEDNSQKQAKTEPSEPLNVQTHDLVMGSEAEKSSLQMIADELKRATTDQAMVDNTQDEKNQNTSDQKQNNLPGYIPPDSELLATNTALAAYNALSSHVPPAASLANVQLAAVPLPIVAADYLPARIQLLINSLPVLDNLASQLLRVFAIGPYQKIIDLASSPETPSGAAFRDLTSLFEFTKRLYSEEDPFLTVEHLAPGMWKEGEKTPSMFRSREQTIESTLRKVNLATFLAATLGTIEVGFFYLNESFLDVFCPYNNLDPANSMSNMNPSNMSLQSGVNTIIGDKVGKLLKSQAVLYLDLKTQAYISAIEAGERSREEILEDILPSNLEQILLERRGVKSLSPSEVDFVARCKSRKETLLNYPEGSNLSEEYEWFEFLKEMFDYVAKNMGFLIWGKRGKPHTRSERNLNTPIPTTTPPVSNTPHSEETLREVSMNTAVDHIDPAASQEINDITSALLPSEIQEQQIHIRINPRMQGKVTNRRPWTREEEKALRHALELKGPSWSTILELFGQGGRINESLKNRTQVQLKDKARNWKMFFLKSGLPVPAYLSKVTGDLERDDKSRAKNARNKKTAAAPVPTVAKKDGEGSETAFNGAAQDAARKRRKVA